jgi:hypothetical protein
MGLIGMIRIDQEISNASPTRIRHSDGLELVDGAFLNMLEIL